MEKVMLLGKRTFFNSKSVLGRAAWFNKDPMLQGQDHSPAKPPLVLERPRTAVPKPWLDIRSFETHITLSVPSFPNLSD